MVAPALSILSAGSAILGGYAQYQESNAQAAAAEHNAQIAERNAALSASQAAQASERGALEELNLRRQQRELASKQNVAVANSGTTLGGSNMNIMAGSAYEAEMDAAMIRYNTANERYAYENQQADNYAQANMYRAQASNAKKAGRMGLFNTVLGAGLQLAGNLYNEDSAAVQLGNANPDLPNTMAVYKSNLTGKQIGNMPKWQQGFNRKPSKANPYYPYSGYYNR